MLWSDQGSIVIVVTIYEGAVWILFMRLSYLESKQEKLKKCLIKTQLNENRNAPSKITIPNCDSYEKKTVKRMTI